MNPLPPSQQQSLMQENQDLESTSKLLAADGIAQSLAFTFERKYLNGISDSTSHSPFCLNAIQRASSPSRIHWIKITRIGKQISENAEQCFSVIQKILLSCFIPYKVQLIFLLHGDNGTFEMFVGVRTYSDSVDSSFANSLSDFIQGIWPGMRCQRITKKEDLNNINVIREKIYSEKSNDDTYNFIGALTGIPSMENQYKGLHATSIDALMTGMRKKNFTYMVIADPLPETDIDGVLYQLRDFNGQAESLKTFTYSENESDSFSKAISKSKGWTESKKQKSRAGAIVSGLVLASALFPPAAAITTTILGVTKAIDRLTGVNVISSFFPSYTRTQSESTSTSVTSGTTHGKSITQNIVNKQIEAASKHLDMHSRRFETGKALGCWSVGVYLFAETQQDLQGSAIQLKSIVSGQESAYEPIRFHQINDVFKDQQTLKYTLGSMDAPNIKIQTSDHDNNPMFFSHPLGEHFNDLKTVLTTKELSYYINFPLHSTPGISVVEAPAGFSLSEQKLADKSEAISIGKLVWSGSSSEIGVKLPLDTLTRHALVCGVNGSGKTNTVLSILDGFAKANRPFFVIEPAKTEYVDWAIKYNEQVKDPSKKIKIFIPGCEKYAKADFIPSKLRLNPFEVISLQNSEMRVLSHIDRLKATFAAAFPMQDILPVIVEHLLYELYTEKHPMLDKEDALYMKRGFPTLATADREFIDELMSNIGYARENTQNISAALRTRFKSLTYGWKGEMLNNPRLADMSWDELFGSRVVVNLSYAGDDQDRAFIMSLLLQFLYEYRIAESETGKISFDANECRHLVVVEEAHRVMARCDNPESPLYKSAQMFSNFLSEVRAYGQGMMVVDQVPTRLIEDAIKNTNVKIIHKLVASDDSQRIAECIGLSSEQQKVIAKLSVGQAVLAGFNSANVMSGDSSDTYLAQINYMKN